MAKRRRHTPAQCRVTQVLEAGPRKWLWLLSKGEREFTKGRVPMGRHIAGCQPESLITLQEERPLLRLLPARPDLPPPTRRLGNH